MNETEELPGRGKLAGTVLKLAWPAAFEALFLGLVDLVDTKMVSDLGITAVAAVGLTSQPKRLLLMFILAINVAATAVISQLTGRKDQEGANRAMHQFLILSAIASALLYSVGFLFARPFMFLCGAEADTVGMATTYFRILVVGQFIQALGLTINACQRGVGDTKVAMITNVSANVVNVVFNYLLIYGKLGFPRLGVAGAALATSLGSVVAFLIALYTVTWKKKSKLRLRWDQWKLEREFLATIRPITTNAFGEQFFQRMGMLIYVLIVAKLGTVAFGTYQICMNITNFECYTYDGFAIAATALVGQSVGAENPKLARRYAKWSVWLAYATAVAIGLPTILFRYQIMSLFEKEDPLVVSAGGASLILVAIGGLVCAGASTYAGALRGAGDTKTVAVCTLWSTTILRPIVSWVLCWGLGLELTGVWLGFLAGHVTRWIALKIHFDRGGWRGMALPDNRTK